MSSYWVTTGSTNPEAVVNPLNAACTEWDYVPDEIRILGNPGVQEYLNRIRDLLDAVVRAHGGDPPRIETTSLEDETNFDAVVGHFRDAVEECGDEDEVCIDVTPGRKFVSAIAFQAGMQLEVDYLSYLYVTSGKLFGRSYAALPRTGTQLYDFTEVF